MYSFENKLKKMTQEACLYQGIRFDTPHIYQDPDSSIKRCQYAITTLLKLLRFMLAL
jgi:hypothetical protein